MLYTVNIWFQEDLVLVWFGCVGPGFWDPVMGYPIFQGFFLYSKGGWTPFNQAVGAPDYLGLWRNPTASSILTPYNSCDLIPPMRGTQQYWNFVWREGPYNNCTALQNQLASPEWFVIDPTLEAVALRALEASKKDFRPQAILKLHHSSSLDYIAWLWLLVAMIKW